MYLQRIDRWVCNAQISVDELIVVRAGLRALPREVTRDQLLKVIEVELERRFPT